MLATGIKCKISMEIHGRKNDVHVINTALLQYNSLVNVENELPSLKLFDSFSALVDIKD